MAANTLYVVDFHDVLFKFKKVVGDPELPEIDPDQVKYSVMAMFIQVDPFAYLKRIATEMTKMFVYETDVSLAPTAEHADDEEQFVRDYMREAILDLGRAMHAQLVSLGMLRTGHERYVVINRPLTDDTYLFKPTRP